MRLFLFAALAISPALARAQFPSPEIDTLFPPGGQAGTTFQVELTGTDLDDLTGLRFTDPSITAEPVILPADEIWPEPRPDGLKFTVRIEANVPAGMHEVRSVGRFGLSTPRIFVVSPNKGASEVTVAAGNETLETATPIELEQTINAQTTPNRSDHYKLSVRRGQRVLVHVWGERIDSRIDAIVSVVDPSGKEIAASLNEIGLDPLGDFTAAADGEYIIKVSDNLFSGGPPYFYRLIASTAPWLDGVFPPAGTPETRQKFTLYGRNLPGGEASEIKTAHGDPLQTKEVEIDLPATGNPALVDGGKVLQGIAEGFDYREGASNPLRIGLARDELIVEDGNLDEQVVKTPCEVVGRFDRSGDQDRYRFSASKDEAFVIEVIADRMAIPVDPTLILQQIVKPAPDAPDQKETSRFIAEEDDIVMKSLIPQDGVGFDTRSRDARILFTAPEDGEYRIVLGNNMSHAGELAPYRLGLRKARPGFQLIAVQDKNWQEGRNAMPGVTRVPAGGTSFIRILALREDGFNGPITLAVSGLPTGVFAPPMAIVGPNDEGYMVLSASSYAQDWVGEIEITGSASLDGKEVTVPAQTGTLVWSAQDPTKNRTRSRLTTRFALQVSGEPAGLAIAAAETKIWRVELNKPLDLPVKLTKGNEVKAPFNVTPYGLPGFTRPPVLNLSGDEGVLKINFNQDGNNKPVAGEVRFVLRLDGVLGKYRSNPDAAAYWAARKTAIDALANRLTAAKGKADNAVNNANTERSNAEKVAAEHANASQTMAQALTEAQATYDAAKRDAEVAATAAQTVPEAWLAAVMSARDAHQAAHPALEAAAADARAKADASKKAATDAEAALQIEVAADEGHRRTLDEAVQAAKDALKAGKAAVAAAEKALAEHLAPRIALANAAATEDLRFRIAKQAAGLAASEIVQVTAEHEATAKTLVEAMTKADEALKAPEAALASTTKAVTDKETAKFALEMVLADARAQLEATMKAAADVNAAMDAHNANLAILTEAKTKAETDAKNAETAMVAAAKSIADAEADLLVLKKTQSEAQTKFEEAKKLADDAAAAIPAEEKSHAHQLAMLSAARDSTAQTAQAAEPIFQAAAKRVTDHDANKGALEQAVTDAKANIEPARIVLADAEAKVMETQGAHEPALAKLTTAKRTAELALGAAETVRTSADHALEESAAAATALTSALTEAQAAVDAAKAAVLVGDPAKISELTTAAHNANAAFSIARKTLAAAKQALDANAAAKPILEQAAAEAAALAEAAKVEAARLAELVTKANAAKTLAQQEAQAAQNRANEKDVKFTVFSEPIDLRIAEPPAK